MTKADLAALNAILKELYVTESQVDVADFCEFRLNIQDMMLYLKYTHWLIDNGYVRSEHNPIQLVWITSKGRSKVEAGGLKMKDLKPKTSKLDPTAKWVAIIGGIIGALIALYTFIVKLIGS